MRILPSHPRGMALVMAMIVVVLITMLVAGAISFTGTERGAAQLQERGDHMSSCMQAARNIFVSRMRALNVTGVSNISFDMPLTVDEFGMPETQIATRHFSGTPTRVELELNGIQSVRNVTATVQSEEDNVFGIDNNPGLKQGVVYYAVTATCRETNDPASPEREIEFLVRIGL
jgi:hypothetical protein